MENENLDLSSKDGIAGKRWYQWIRDRRRLILFAAAGVVLVAGVALYLVSTPSETNGFKTATVARGDGS